MLTHLRLVVSVSRQFKGYGLPQADLIQEGNVGLMKAVKRFDPTRGVRLVSFALLWIKAEIHEYILRNWQLVKIATTKAQRKLFFNLRSIKQALGVQDSVSNDQAKQIARELNVAPSDVLKWISVSQAGMWRWRPIAMTRPKIISRQLLTWQRPMPILRSW